MTTDDVNAVELQYNPDKCRADGRAAGWDFIRDNPDCTDEQAEDVGEGQAWEYSVYYDEVVEFSNGFRDAYDDHQRNKLDIWIMKRKLDREGR